MVAIVNGEKVFLLSPNLACETRQEMLESHYLILTHAQHNFFQHKQPLKGLLIRNET